MGILTGCLPPRQTDWLPNYWGLVLLCGEIIITGKHNKRLMGRGCQLVCVCVWGGVCVSKCVMASFLYQHSFLCGWVSRPSLTIVLSHLSTLRTHTGNQKSPHKHTKCRLGGEVVLRRSELGVKVERDRETQMTLLLLMFYCQCWKWLFFVEQSFHFNTSSKLFINNSTFYNNITVHFSKCEAWDKESSRRREVTVKAEPLLGGTHGGKDLA